MIRKNQINILISVFCLILISCDEDSLAPEIDTKVQVAKNWFDTVFDKSPYKSSANSRVDNSKKWPVWSKGISYNLGGNLIIEVPLDYETVIVAKNRDNKIPNYKNLTKLLLIKNKRGYDMYIMRILPSKSSLEDIEDNSYRLKTSSFNGEILYTDWNENPILYSNYKDGKRISRNYLNKITSAKERAGGKINNSCFTVTIEWTQTVCIESVCFESYLDSDTYFICVQSYQDQWLDPNTDSGGGDLGSSLGEGTIEDAIADYEQIYGHLTEEEKRLIRENPWVLPFLVENKREAEAETVRRFGVNGLNDKSDAFRHAYFNSLNTVDLGEEIARKLGVAHESEVPNYLNKEKQMDLFNNNFGIDITSASIFAIGIKYNDFYSNQIYNSILNGDLRYLQPIDYSDQCFDGCFAYPLGTHGITAATILTPTNL